LIAVNKLYEDLIKKEDIDTEKAIEKIYLSKFDIQNYKVLKLLDLFESFHFW
jgi:hypothetical protein